MFRVGGTSLRLLDVEGTNDHPKTLDKPLENDRTIVVETWRMNALD